MYTKTYPSPKPFFLPLCSLKPYPFHGHVAYVLLKTTDSCQNKGSRMLLGPSGEDSQTLKRRFYNASLGWYAVKTCLPRVLPCS